MEDEMARKALIRGPFTAAQRSSPPFDPAKILTLPEPSSWNTPTFSPLSVGVTTARRVPSGERLIEMTPERAPKRSAMSRAVSRAGAGRRRPTPHRQPKPKRPSWPHPERRSGPKKKTCYPHSPQQNNKIF
jgi:hypothetical protein